MSLLEGEATAARRPAPEGGRGPPIAVHLLSFEDDATPLADLAAGLSEEERSRLRRYRRPEDRRAFAQRRTALRRILGARLGRPASGLRFVYGVAGRPFLDGEEVSFSLAHSRGRALIVVSDRVEVGCDLEWVDPALDWRAAAAEAFTPAERRRLACCAPTARRRFYRLWTLKEARLKCAGTGLPALPDLGAGGPGEGWRALRAGGGYMAAVAWRPHPPRRPPGG